MCVFIECKRTYHIVMPKCKCTACVCVGCACSNTVWIKKMMEKHALIVMVCGSSGLTEAINILDALF